MTPDYGQAPLLHGYRNNGLITTHLATSWRRKLGQRSGLGRAIITLYWQHGVADARTSPEPG
jgi:hypothetical protein